MGAKKIAQDQSFDSTLTAPIPAFVINPQIEVLATNVQFRELCGLRATKQYFRPLNELGEVGKALAERITATLKNEKYVAEILLQKPDAADMLLSIHIAELGDNFVVHLLDLSLENTLHHKYRHELKQKSDLLSVLDQKLLEEQLLTKILHEAISSFADNDKMLTEIIFGELPIEKIRVLEKKSQWTVRKLLCRNGAQLSAEVIDEATLVRALEKGQDFSQGSLWAIPYSSKSGKQSFYFYEFQAGSAIPSKTFLANLTFSLATLEDKANLYLNSITDQKTETYTYAFFMQRMQEEISRAQRYNHPLSVLMVDLDFFKKINDTYGHLTGDQVLQVTAKTLRDLVRHCDIVARFGGEEFIVLLPETDVTGAVVVAEKIRKALEALRVKDISNPQNTVQFTASLGVATYPSKGETAQNLLDYADQCLYKAKRSGRNRVEFSTSEV